MVEHATCSFFPLFQIKIIEKMKIREPFYTTHLSLKQSKSPDVSQIHLPSEGSEHSGQFKPSKNYDEYEEYEEEEHETEEPTSMWDGLVERYGHHFPEHMTRYLWGLLLFFILLVGGLYYYNNVYLNNVQENYRTNTTIQSVGRSIENEEFPPIGQNGTKSRFQTIESFT